MRRRLTIAIVGTVAVTLVVAGLGTLVLARVGARERTEDDLRDQAAVVSSLLDLDDGQTPRTRPLIRQRLEEIRAALEVEDSSLLVLSPEDQVVADLSDPLPPSLTVERLDPDALRAGEVVSGDLAGRVFAAAATNTGRPTIGVIVLIEPVEPGIGPALRWFVLASAGALVLGGLIAVRLGGQLTGPLRAATAATTSLAAGDLSTRLPEPPGRRRDEVAELTSAINQMAATLERSRGLEQRFLLSISHDLRTPLTSIRGYAEAIADGAAPDPAAAAQVVLDESRRLERLVGDLLDLARLESQDFALALEPVDLAEVARRVVAGFEREASAHSLQLLIHAPADPVVATADADRLAQVLANLIENAMKFAGSRIEVRVAGGPSAPTLSVSDDGPGIPREDLPHVFERLYQSAYRPVRKEVGSGLGLAIVHQLALRMGGTATVESATGRGTTFTVRLQPAEGSPPPSVLA